MKPLRISNKSFEKTSKRFFKNVVKTIDGFNDGNNPTNRDFKERYDSEAIYFVKKSLDKLIENYKSKPFKNKSGYDHKIKSFSVSNIKNRYFRVQYLFDGDNLIFKLLTKDDIFSEENLNEFFLDKESRKPNGNRYKRKSQFVLKIK